jgi:DNA polymerase III delta prime subunit
MIVGHEEARAALERSLPPVTLLMGPRSTGKTTLARHLADLHAHGGTYCRRLSAAAAREIVEGAPVRPHGPHLSVRIIDLDNSTEAAQNILLKVLEEPPSHCRFILIASRNPLATIISRSRTYRVGLLTDVQVAQVLSENCGISGHAAAMAAARGRGQVAPAIAAAEDKESDRITSVVAAAVRAAMAGGGTPLDMALRNWTGEHTVVLRRWATEAASGRWVIFTQDLAPGLSRARALRVLEALSRFPEARTGPAVAMAELRPQRGGGASA